jgi:hypothetical protein
MLHKKVKVKHSRYRPGVAQRAGRGTALLFHDHGTRRGWVVSSTPLPHFTPGKDPVHIVHEAGWAPGPVWTGGKSCPHRDSIPDHPARSQSLYWLCYPVHCIKRSMCKPSLQQCYKQSQTLNLNKWDTDAITYLHENHFNIILSFPP